MDDLRAYQDALSQALAARHDWLEKTELSRLKEEFRTFHSAFSSIYQILLKKAFLQEDPYKHEAKIGEIEIPSAEDMSESKKVEELSIRLSNYDNQLDFLVNFYQFSAEFLTMDRIKRILGLVKYIDWTRFTNSSANANTRALSEIIDSVKPGVDQFSWTLVNDSLQDLDKSTTSIIRLLKEIADYHRENLKYEIRIKILNTLNIDPAHAMARKNDIISQIKKKYTAALGGKPYYPDIIEEIFKEDYSSNGKALRDEVLKNLAIPDSKPKIQKKQVSFKLFLIDGLRSLGTTSNTVADILLKIDENNELMESMKNSFWDKVKRLMQQMMNKEPEPIIYDLQFIDPVRGTTTKERVNYYNLRQDLEKKVRTLGNFSIRSGNTSRFESMEDEQLLALLDRSVKEVQNMHRTLSALDDYFKASADPEIRDKVKGIKPELSTIKNAIISANQKRHEYTSQKEEEEQLRRLGLTT
ncbi:hypothetical protein [Breznakiella homolactica]|uniref:Uncharacterized protein n=1 Tax=Breznakiella homolactica TaxID=2798577 RepID=A0A7T8BC48_9SPIR|nr:hypothetical protein [Breznakiella homolactica]QQO11061.1 hypothetical protein JFL75_09135 [Breznakiella homolactica]